MGLKDEVIILPITNMHDAMSGSFWVAYHSAATVDSCFAQWVGPGLGRPGHHSGLLTNHKSKTFSFVLSVLYFICFTFQHSELLLTSIWMSAGCQLSALVKSLQIESATISIFIPPFCFCTTSFYFKVQWSSLHNSHVHTNTTYW